MEPLEQVKWMEWFSLAMLFVTLGLPIFFLVQALKRHHLEDLDCSKFEVFSTDAAPDGVEVPAMPISCQPGYARPWAHAINVQWIWVTLGIGLIWGLIMLGAFIASRGIEALRNAAPV